MRVRHRQKAGQTGFTLLEMLVAVALLAVLGVAASLTLNSALRSEQHLTDSTQSLQRLSLSLQLMQRDLEQIVARRGRDAQGDARSQVLFAETDDVVLDFYRSGRRRLSPDAPGSSLEHVRYRLLPTGLVRESSALLDTPPGRHWRRATLLTTLSDVELRFFRNGRWTEHWPPLRATGAGGGLPRAVELTLETPRYGPVSQVVLLPEASG